MARRNLDVAKDQMAKEREGAAARSQMYARRATNGDLGLFRDGSEAAGGAAGAGDGEGPTARNRQKSAAAAAQEAQAAGAHRKSQALNTYTDGGSAAAVALQVGTDRSGPTPTAEEVTQRKSQAF